MTDQRSMIFGAGRAPRIDGAIRAWMSGEDVVVVDPKGGEDALAEPYQDQDAEGAAAH